MALPFLGLGALAASRPHVLQSTATRMSRAMRLDELGAHRL